MTLSPIWQQWENIKFLILLRCPHNCNEGSTDAAKGHITSLLLYPSFFSEMIILFFDIILKYMKIIPLLKLGLVSLYSIEDELKNGREGSQSPHDLGISVPFFPGPGNCTISGRLAGTVGKQG